MRPRNRTGHLLAAALLLSAGLTPRALADEPNPDEGLEITGLILDHTKTQVGRNFVQLFHSRWREVPGLAYTITIIELPDGSRGSRLLVKVDDRLVYAKRAQPRYEWLEAESQVAVSAVGSHLLRQLKTDRLLQEEFQY